MISQEVLDSSRSRYLSRPKSYGKFWVSADYSSDISAGDHIKFDSVHSLNSGSEISLDTSTSYVNTMNTASIGRFTLKAGIKYKLTASIITGNSATASEMNWYNSDTNTVITDSIKEEAKSPDATSSDVPQVTTHTYFYPLVDTRVEVRIVNAGAIASVNGKTGSNSGVSWAEIEAVEYIIPVIQKNLIAIFEDQKTSGTNGGTATVTTWTRHVLQTTVRNDSNFATIDITTNIGRVTLPAGKYIFRASGIGYNIGTNFAYRVYNITDSQTVKSSMTARSANPTIGECSIVSGVYTITSTKSFELQYFFGGSSSVQDLGIATGSGEVEIYARLEIERIG